MIRVNKTCCEDCRYPVDPAFCLRRYLCPCHMDALTDEEYKEYLREEGL